MTITEQNEALVEAGRLNEEMKAISAKVEKEKRGYTDDENVKYAALENAFDEVKARVDRAVADDKRTKDLQNFTSGQSVRMPLENSVTSTRPNASAEYKAAFETLLREGEGRMSTALKATLVKTTGTAGGYLAPVEYEKKIIENAYPKTLMRQYATVDTSTSDSAIPMEGALPTFGWIDELGTYPVTDVSFGQGTMSAWKEGGIILVSEELLSDSFLDLPSYIGRKAGTAKSLMDDAAYFLGDGVKKPTGIAVSATLGYTSASTTTPTADEVLDFMDTLPDAYDANARLVTTKAFRSKLRKLKDSTGQFLWQPGLQAGVPNLFNGKELVITPYLGALVANGVPAIYGDLSYYQILDRQGVYMQQLNERYAENGMVGFKINSRTDGKLLVTAAVVKFKMAAA